MSDKQIDSAGQHVTSGPETESQPPRHFSRRKPIIVAVIVVFLFAVLLVMALRPRQMKEREVMEAVERTQGAPTVLVAKAALVPARGELLLPGSIQAIAETPIFSRSEGYLRKRLVDIGDQVRAEQLLAVVEAPEVDKQVQQAQAALARTEASLAQTKAALEQSNTQLKLAEVTAQRWNTLFTKRVVSRQEADEKQAAYDARRADNEAARANVAASGETVAASKADLQRLMDLKGFQEIRAPFAGIITARNTDVGALIRGGASEGHELFRLAQIGTVRITVNVPQMNIPAIRLGEPATVAVQERPGSRFSGKIVRTANALDPTTRTLLTEVQVSNPNHILLPGMYAQVRFSNGQAAPVVMVSGDTLVIRSDGPQVALVREDGRIHFQKVTLGRDYGMESEITSGLTGGESLVINPSDDIQEGVVVKARVAKEAAASGRQKK
jgi:RND family efflux transporter MFP subunit